MQREQGTFYLGVDGGGTKCKVQLLDQNNKLLGSAISGPANPLRGLEQTINSIMDATEQAFEQAGLDLGLIDQVTAGIGLAGVNLPKYMKQVTSWDHPFRDAYFTTDMHIACLGAHDGKDGAVIITGTGSCGFSAVGDEHLSLGGHGFLMGDKGSGAWLGLTALQKMLEAEDKISPKTQLAELLYQESGCNNLLSLLENVSGSTPSQFARYAPLVFKAADMGDEVAIGILRDGASYISSMANRLLQNHSLKLSLIGGLAPYISKWLDNEIKEKLTAPANPPETGAILFAQQQANK